MCRFPRCVALLSVFVGLVLLVAAHGDDSFDPAPWLKVPKGPGPVKADIFNDRATGQEKPRNGGEATLHFRGAPRMLEDWIDNSAVISDIFSWIASSLATVDYETWEFTPSLAESWSGEDMLVLADGKRLFGKISETADSYGIQTAQGAQTFPKAQVKGAHRQVAWTFKLNKAARWQDGQPVTAKDVLFTWQCLKCPYIEAPSLQNYYEKLDQCDFIDDYTVRLVYAEQYWKAFEFASGFAIRPKHLLDPQDLVLKDPKAFGKSYMENPFHQKPIYSGPYQVEDHQREHSVTLKRVENFWDPKAAGHLDRLKILFISDTVAALQGLKNGEIDFTADITPEQFDGELTSSESFKKQFAKAEFVNGRYGYIGWNMRRSPFDDKRVRQAMDFAAFDKDKFLKEVLNMRAVVTTGPQFIFGCAYDYEVKPRPYDPKKAEDLLLEAGWYDHDGDGLRDKDGKPFRFEFLMPQVDSNHPGKRRADIIQANLKKLGIDMQVRMLEWGSFLDKIEQLDFDSCTLSWMLGNPPAENDPYQIWHSSQSGPKGSNHVGFVNERVDQICVEGRLELDPAKRRAMYKEMHRIVFDEAPYQFQYQPEELAAVNKKFRGVKFFALRPGYDPTKWFIPEEELPK